MLHISDFFAKLGLRLLDRRGTVAVVFAIMVIPLASFAGVGIDYGRLVHMKTTLQAATDTAAISGAAANFGTAAQETTPGDGPYTIATNFFKDTWLPPDLKVTSTVTAPATTSLSGATVTVSATAQVGLSFLAIWLHQVPVSVTSTATAEIPGAATGSFPFTVPECIFTSPDPVYWNATTGEPTNNPKTGLPYEIVFDSSYHTTNNCTYGEWTSLLNSNTSASTAESMITSGCGCILSTGDNIYIDTGTKASLYKTAASLIGQTVLVPVVSQDNLTSGGTATVIGFAPLVIDSTNQGSKTITGHLTSNYQGGGLSGTGGTYYGTDIVKLIN